MAGIWDYLNKLFEKVEKSSSTEPVIHEVISRSQAQKTFNANFKNGLIHRQLLDWLKVAFSKHQSSQANKDENIKFTSANAFEGFVIYFQNTNYQKKEIIAFFDLLKENILPYGYYNYLSDSRAYIRENKKEETQRHYLKPSLRQNKNTLATQKFGNITIELIFQNNNIQYLKFSAATYRDALNEEAESFKELMELIVD